MTSPTGLAQSFQSVLQLQADWQVCRPRSTMASSRGADLMVARWREQDSPVSLVEAEMDSSLTMPKCPSSEQIERRNFTPIVVVSKNGRFRIGQVQIRQDPAMSEVDKPAARGRP